MYNFLTNFHCTINPGLRLEINSAAEQVGRSIWLKFFRVGVRPCSAKATPVLFQKLAAAFNLFQKNLARCSLSLLGITYPVSEITFGLSN